MNRHRWVRVGLACGWLVLAPSLAHGQDQSARETEAKRECAAGRYQRGIDALATLYADTGEPIYVYNQGRCYEENGRLDEAVTRFREYVRKLQGTPDSASEIAEVEARIKGLEDRAARARATTLALERPAPAPPAERPLYRKGWFWVAVGAVAAGSATAFLLANRSQEYRAPSCPDCSLSLTGVPTR